MLELWPSLYLSLRIALAAMVVTALLALPLALLMSRRRFVGKSLVEALILLPLVLPPTVVGYFLIVAFGARGVVGQYLDQLFGYSILFRFEGAVLAAATVALPMLYLPAKAGFATVNRDLEDIALLLGASRWRTFWRITLPLAWHGILSGLLLAFARALGEFGATVMVFGWSPGRLTLPISVYSDYEQGELGKAAVAAVALTLVSLFLVVLYNRSTTTIQLNNR
ncbi:MAG: molybdate ABC transporter permease subunit [Planctomycetota bacterium]|nr:molybdate ABC transporter permease subunit [Planctomycetota bacterium]